MLGLIGADSEIMNLDDTHTLSSAESAELRRLLAKLLDPIASERALAVADRGGVAERVYRSRRLRDKFFPEQLFADPAWDILLLLYSLERADKRLSVSAVCESAGVPVSTGHRWVQRLVDNGLAMREQHPTDRRVSWLRLPDSTLSRLDAYLDEMMAGFIRT
jgi:DNA-binding MarR family transcriptional regulator